MTIGILKLLNNTQNDWNLNFWIGIVWLYSIIQECAIESLKLGTNNWWITPHDWLEVYSYWLLEDEKEVVL